MHVRLQGIQLYTVRLETRTGGLCIRMASTSPAKAILFLSSTPPMDQMPPEDAQVPISLHQ